MSDLAHIRCKLNRVSKVYLWRRTCSFTFGGRTRKKARGQKLCSSLEEASVLGYCPTDLVPLSDDATEPTASKVTSQFSFHLLTHPLTDLSATRQGVLTASDELEKRESGSTSIVHRSSPGHRFSFSKKGTALHAFAPFTIELNLFMLTTS